MIIWKKEPVDSDMDWILVDENDNTNVIASITVSENSENSDGVYNVEAACKKIGYTCRFEHLNKDKLKTIVPALKKTVKYEINHLREENQKPTDKKIYRMIDGIPMWQHLKNDVEEIQIHLQANDYGKLTEILGNRILQDMLQRGRIIDNIFPGIEIVRIHYVKKFKILERTKIGLGDVVIEVDYKKDDVFGKKIIIFEIKHGKFKIEQNQLRRYCSMILKPEEYFRKADELKVIYMLFDNIDTLNASAFYSIQEIDKDFAITVLAQAPVGIDYYRTEPSENDMC